MKRIIGTYAFCHFAVDFCCVATMLCAVSPALRQAGPFSGAAAVVAYDMFAFMLQLPIGAALDGYEGGGRAAMLSYVLVAAGGAAAFLPGTAVAACPRAGMTSRDLSTSPQAPQTLTSV